MDIGNIIGICLAIFVCFILYTIIGGFVCPDAIKNRALRILYILFWPICLFIGMLAIPFGIVYEFSKNPEQSEQEFNEFIKKNKQ